MSTTTTVQTTQVYQVFILATPEQIWDAITKPEFTERYFHGVRIELRDGRRFSALGDMGWDEEILEADEPRRLVHRWIAGYDPEMAAEEPSRVTWEIQPQEDGTTHRCPRPARGSSEDGRERLRHRLDVRAEQPEDLPRDREAAQRLSPIH